MTEFEHWRIEEAGRTAQLALDGAGDLNMLNGAVLAELRDLARSLRERDDLSAIVVSGAGNHFSAGMDPSIIRQMVGQDRAAFAEGLRDAQDCIDEFERLPQILVASIRGFCIGGGMILAACCDFRYADERAVFSLPEVKRGIGVIMGAARIARLVGEAKAKQWILLGDRLRAREALAAGYLNAVAPGDRLDAKVAELTGKLSRLPADALKLNKRILNEDRQLSIRASQKREIELQGELLDSPDFRAAIEKFFE